MPAKCNEVLALHKTAESFLARDNQGVNRMRVLFAASECSPLARTGGLEEAVVGLVGALGRNGVYVTVAIPRYRHLGGLGVEKEAPGPLRPWPGSNTTASHTPRRRPAFVRTARDLRTRSRFGLRGPVAPVRSVLSHRAGSGEGVRPSAPARRPYRTCRPPLPRPDGVHGPQRPVPDSRPTRRKRPAWWGPSVVGS